MDAVYARVVAAIRHRLTAAQKRGSIRLRDDFKETWNRAVGDDPGPTDLTVLTTNWDEVFINRMVATWQGGVRPELLHLHGGLKPAAGTLLLPAETAIEPYRPQDSPEAQELLKRRQVLADCIEEADVLVLWGIGLSPLDAELMQAIQKGLYAGDLRPRVIRIVNPEHRQVARRLMALKPLDWEPGLLPDLSGWSDGEVCRYEWP